MTATTDHYVGIDLHKRQAQVAVLDDEGEVVEEVRVANADLDEIAQKYAGSSAALDTYPASTGSVPMSPLGTTQTDSATSSLSS